MGVATAQMKKSHDRCPSILPILVVGNDPELLAQISCALAKRGAYLPIVDGPRMTRQDRAAEAIRRTNAAARAKAKEVIFANLGSVSSAAVSAHLPDDVIKYVNTSQEVSSLAKSPSFETALHWGPERIGLGLLKALREKRQIIFDLPESPKYKVSSISGHMVICEDGDPLSQVIAANYAFSLGASLNIINPIESEIAESILERFYSLYENREKSATDILLDLKSELRTLAADLQISPGGSATFISKLPFGFAFPEVPTTHLFAYPDLGISIINGFASEQAGTMGIGVAVLVDPERAEAPEMRVAEKVLRSRQIFTRGYRGPGASVHNISRMVELFPYDLLLIATHCGDASGWRWTYEYIDSEGIARTLVVDIAIGVGDPNPKSDDGEKLLNVTQIYKIISLDGIDWTDPVAKKNLYVGRAILDWGARLNDPDFEPIHKKEVSRVVGSSALQMYDHNLIALPTTFSGQGTPIVFNNACGSWHQLAATFTFGNARAYIGTLFMVSTSEAAAIASKALERHFGKPLPLAIWLAQNEVYGEGPRRPYIVNGTYCQRFRSVQHNTPEEIARKLYRDLISHKKMRDNFNGSSDSLISLDDRISYLERELRGIEKRWLNPKK